MLNQINGVRELLRGKRAAAQNSIDLAVPQTLSLTFVPKWITRLEEEFAPTNSRLMALNVHDAVLQLVEGGCDLLLCYHHPRQPMQLDPGVTTCWCWARRLCVPMRVATRRSSSSSYYLDARLHPCLSFPTPDDTTEGSRKWNSTFKAFADYWGFEPRVCPPYRPQTKGKVESGVKYVKRNFLPGRHFRDLEDLNEQLQRWTLEVADLRVHGTTHQRPIERFAEEAKALVPTASQLAFLDAVVRERVVAEDWLVAIDSNRHSVPCRLIGKRVQVLRIGGHSHISHGGELVAQHPVLAGRFQLSVQAEHGPGAAARDARQRYSSIA